MIYLKSGVRERLERLVTYYENDKKEIKDKKEQKEDDILLIYKELDDEAVMDYEKKHLLHIAAFYSDAKAIEYLLQEGHLANCTDDLGNTPLHELAKRYTWYNREDADVDRCIRLLIEAGASPRCKNSDGYTAYHIGARDGQVAFMKTLIDLNVPLKGKDPKGCSLLHTVADQSGRIHGYLQSVHTPEERQKEEKKEADYIELAKILVGYGLNIEAKDKEGNRPYEIAASYDDSLMAVILQGDYNPDDPKFPLQLAAKGKSLHQAARDKDLEALEALIELGQDVEEIGQEIPFVEQTPLAVACMQMDEEMILRLLESGANPNFKTGDREYTAMYWMAKYAKYSPKEHEKDKLKKIMDILIKAGLDIDDSVDIRGNTALACLYSPHVGHRQEYAFGSFEDIFAKELLERGADVNKANREGKTPLLLWMENQTESNEKALLELLDHGADVSVRSGNGETILITLAKNRFAHRMIDALDILENFGMPDIEAVNNEGKTALEIATQNANEDLATWIMERM